MRESDDQGHDSVGQLWFTVGKTYVGRIEEKRTEKIRYVKDIQLEGWEGSDPGLIPWSINKFHVV
jgi:hypothetical protein